MTMREMTCCFTGHRRIPEEDKHKVKKYLDKTIRQLIDRGIVYYGAGGALGFDTMAAQAVLYLRDYYFPQIKLILVLPCEDQAVRWNYSNREIYEEIKAKADKCVYMSKYYTEDCMYRRNRHLVDNSNICICYLTEDKGGTKYTVDYAIKRGLEIINLADKINNGKKRI